MTDRRAIETGLARFTLAALLVYFPMETWVSWPHGLWNPFYIVDFIAMVLMFWGARVSLRARPERAPGMLAVAYAWAACNGWRATWWRVFEVVEGGELEHGAAELWVVAAASAIGLACFALSLVLVVRERAAAR